MADAPRELRIELRGFRGTSHYRLWNVGEGKIVGEGVFEERKAVDLGTTADDMIVAVTPAD
jgi:hypothetical protein